MAQIATYENSFSDHSLVTANLSIVKPQENSSCTSYRQLRKIDIKSFNQAIQSSELPQFNSTSCDEHLECFNKVLRNLLDDFAPVLQKKTRRSNSQPWFDSTILEARSLKRASERTWRKTGLCIHRQAFALNSKLYYDTIRERKCAFYQEKIATADSKELFKIVKSLTAITKTLLLHTNEQALATDISDYFTSKIQNIRNVLEATSDGNPVTERCLNQEVSLPQFKPVTSEDVLKIIKSYPIKTCKLDPIPAALLKEALPVLLPTITQIINLSLQKATIPSELKRAIVIPSIKKPSLDPNILANYRPISNLPFISKVLERVVAQQLQQYLQENELYDTLQSAYRANHSTETALLKVFNDIMLNIDQGHETILCLLDLSSAFDTIDHKILLNRLEQRFGLTKNALAWLTSYLENRYQSVVINTATSPTKLLSTGVPQGSVLGPILFTLYMSPLGDLIREKGCLYTCYADDTQLYVNVKMGSSDARTKLENCIDSIRIWMASNRLKLNEKKTELLHLQSRFKKTGNQQTAMTIGNDTVSFSKSVKNLGFMFDESMKMDAHISHMSKSSYAVIRKISHLRKYLDGPTTEKLVHAFLTSRLDYCNSLLFGIPDNLLQHVQRFQNTAARIVTKTRKYDHITPIFQSLHWLPVRQRISF